MADQLDSDSIDLPLGLSELTDDEPLDTVLVVSNGQLRRARVARLAPTTSAAAPPPTVALDLPLPGTIGILTDLVAHASAAAGATIAKVEFFLGARKIGQALATPYILSFAPDSVGTFTVTAKATDSNGNSATATQTLAVTVAAGSGNLPPVVRLSVDLQYIELGGAVALTAVASDPDGSVARVEFFDFSDKIGEAAAPPYAISTTPDTLGTHVYSAKATDNLALSTTTDAIPVVVRAVGLVKPDAPTNLVATAGNNTVTLNATPPVQQGSSPVISYHVFRNGSGAPVATSVSLPWTDSAAPNGASYFYELMAHNTAGDSVRSLPSNTVTPVAPAIPAPTYHGAVSSPTPDAGMVQALTAEQWAQAGRTVEVACNGTYPCFAEPASYGVRSIITDGNGYNITADMARTTDLFTVNGGQVSYNVYTHQNAQYDPAFKFSL